MVQTKQVSAQITSEKFTFSASARQFPIVDAIAYRWPGAAAEASEYIEDWKARAGRVLGQHKLSKDTMRCIASHTSRKDGTCPLTDRALSNRSGRTLASTKRDIGRLKKLGFLIAEIDCSKGYRTRTRRLVLSVPDVQYDDQRIGLNEDQRIPPAKYRQWGSTYGGYVDPIDMGERRDV